MRYVDGIRTTKPYSVIGLGTWQFGSREWGYGDRYDETEAKRIVARARELGVTVIDTAEIYGFGRSERIVGERSPRFRRHRRRSRRRSFRCCRSRRSSSSGAWPRAGSASARLDLYQIH